MNAYRLIREAYEGGMKPAEVYRPYTKLYNTLRKFIDRQYFGVLKFDDEEEKWIPKHANWKGCPQKDRRQFKQRDLVRHLFAETRDTQPGFAFMVNGTKSDYVLICFDIDGDDPNVSHGITCDVYHECFVVDYFGGNVWIEASRNRRGKYIYCIVKRTSDPEAFNWLCNSLSKAMKPKFFISKDNKFDAIKATLHFHSDKDDIAHMYGEYLDNRFGVLATMPLAGSLARAEEGWQVINDFVSFFCKRNRRGEYINAIPEAHLRQLLERFSPEGAAKYDKTLATRQKSSQTPQEARGHVDKTAPERKRANRSGARQRLIDKANGETNGKNRAGVPEISGEGNIRVLIKVSGQDIRLL